MWYHGIYFASMVANGHLLTRYLLTYFKSLVKMTSFSYDYIMIK